MRVTIRDHYRKFQAPCQLYNLAKSANICYRFGMPNHLTQGAREAAALRKRVGVPPSAPIDLAWLAANIEVVVIRRPMPAGLSGMHYAHPAGRSFVAINSKDIALRQNFTLAHEIGHHIFDRDQTIVEEVGEGESSPIERRANAFAAHLLLPDDAVALWKKATRRDFDENDVARLAIQYHLSYLATLYRLKSASCIQDVDAFKDKTRMDAMLRGELNAQTQISVEVPPAVLRMADEALERHIISRKRHAAITAKLASPPA